MTLESRLKKAMGYTDDNTRRCGNCTHVADDTVDGLGMVVCTANKAAQFLIDPDFGRCDHFSAKRPRRQGQNQDDDDGLPISTVALPGPPNRLEGGEGFDSPAGGE